MNPSAVTVRIAKPILIDIFTTIADAILGKMRHEPAPVACAADTNNSCFFAITSPRTRRA
jgi:hypothetical protein